MTKSDYITFFNLRVEFNKELRKYIIGHILKPREELDSGAIMHAFVSAEKGPAIRVEYYIKGKVKPQYATILLEEFEKTIFGEFIS